MDKIKEIEQLLITWKAAIPVSKSNSDYVSEAKCYGGVEALKAALEILNRPPNMAIATGLVYECWYCHKKTGKGYDCGTCGREGR